MTYDMTRIHNISFLRTTSISNGTLIAYNNFLFFCFICARNISQVESKFAFTLRYTEKVIHKLTNLRLQSIFLQNWLILKELMMT